MLACISASLTMKVVTGQVCSLTTHAIRTQAAKITKGKTLNNCQVEDMSYRCSMQVAERCDMLLPVMQTCLQADILIRGCVVATYCLQVYLQRSLKQFKSGGVGRRNGRACKACDCQRGNQLCHIPLPVARASS